MGDYERDDGMELREILNWYGELFECNSVVLCTFGLIRHNKYGGSGSHDLRKLRWKKSTATSPV